MMIRNFPLLRRREIITNIKSIVSMIMPEMKQVLCCPLEVVVRLSWHVLCVAVINNV